MKRSLLLLLAACGHSRAVTMTVVPLIAGGLAAMPTATDCTDQPGADCGRHEAIDFAIGAGAGLLVDAVIWHETRHPPPKKVGPAMHDRVGYPQPPLPPAPPSPSPVPQPLPPSPTPPPRLPGAV